MVFKLLGNKKLFFLLLALVFFIAVMGLTLIQRDRIVENSSWPVRILKDTVSWTQGLFFKPAQSIAGFFEDVYRLRIVYEENEALRRTVANYAKDRARLNMLEAENERLKEMLEFTERQKEMNNYRYHIAQVVAINSDPYNETIRVNLGSKDGVELDWAVTTADGLIGQVVAVEPFYSTVQLITNIDDRLPGGRAIAATVLGQEEHSFGIIQSYDRSEGVLLMTRISQEDPLKAGDIVVTSGLGERFPQGLLIGVVEEREVGEYGITHTAKIRPFARFNQLREVFLVEVP